MSSPGSGVTRRRLLGGAAALGAGALLGVTATGSPFGRGDRTVSFWHLFSGGDGKRLAVMLEEYAKAGTGIEVEPLTLTWGPPYSTELALAAAGDRPPDPMFTPDGQELTMDDDKAEQAIASMTEMTRGRQAALAYVGGMLERSLTWAEGGHIPAWQPVVNSQA